MEETAVQVIPLVVEQTKEMDALQAVLFEFAQKHPVVMSLLIIMASMRLFLKPVISLIYNFVKRSPSKSDDEFLFKLMSHPAYLSVVWVIDYLGSIKLPKAEKKAEAPKAEQG